MTALVMLFATLTAVTTMAGGLLAIGLKDRLPLVLGFSAGAVIGVAFFDLLPEALAAGGGIYDARALLGLAALGFFAYALFDRLSVQHGDAGVPGQARPVERPANNLGQSRLPVKGGLVLGAASFSAHSLLDGLMMGIAFQSGREIGLVVAAAVLAHDFSDGLNTVNVVVKNGGERARALRWLAIDAIAPVVGAGLSLLVTPPPNILCVLLAVFGGFFLYIGASDLLPASLRARPRFSTAAAALAGAGVLYLATRLA